MPWTAPACAERCARLREAGAIVLLFADEADALTHPSLAHVWAKRVWAKRVWAKRGADLRIPAPGQSAKVAMRGVLDWGRRKLIVRTSRTKRSSDVMALLTSWRS